MARKRHTAEEIVTKLRQVDVLTAQGKAVSDAIRSIGVTVTSPSEWSICYGSSGPVTRQRTRARRSWPRLRRRARVDEGLGCGRSVSERRVRRRRFGRIGHSGCGCAASP